MHILVSMMTNHKIIIVFIFLSNTESIVSTRPNHNIFNNKKNNIGISNILYYNIYNLRTFYKNNIYFILIDGHKWLAC